MKEQQEKEPEYYGGTADVVHAPLDGGPPEPPLPDAGGAPPMDAAIDQQTDIYVTSGVPDMMMAPLDGQPSLDGLDGQD